MTERRANCSPFFFFFDKTMVFGVFLAMRQEIK